MFGMWQQIKTIVMGKQRQWQVWAIQDFHNRSWHKVVAFSEPTPEVPHMLYGPFRSEIDCEEYCDRRNLAMIGKVRRYSHV